MRLLPALLLALFAFPAAAAECAGPAAVCAQGGPGAMALIEGGRPVLVIADGGLDPGVQRAARTLQSDLARVGGEADGRADGPPGAAVIVGTIGRSPVIDRLAAAGRLDLGGIAGAWEGYVQQLVERPAPGIERALVIAGADKRGTIFGIYDLSERIGVSPWHWWADVPVRRQAALYVLPGRRAEQPAVRYRGIFINDEEPALGNWVRHTFGGFNHRFYERVFELILRMRGNYLWPAMWGKAFYDDDPLNAPLADEMGVVIGTSHHEPMMRAHVEWERYGQGPWDYRRNPERLRAFWREGIERMGDNESLVTIGMRGDGDEPMIEGTAIDLLQTIVRDQRRIIADVTGRPASQTPQVWALYKEVQDYYDARMRVPEDVTLLFADDNWGNIRRLPEPGSARAGGYGVYYHFDYVGGPRNYKWTNTNQIERVWEQMHLAWRHGADRLWIVNVGDIKPMEFPTSFFLDYAWNPEAWPLERLADYPRHWAARQFGDEHAAAIGALLTRYTQYNARRKPELIDADTFSLVNFDEADRVAADWRALAARAEEVGRALPAEAQDAYFQLVLHPILASANLNELYVAVARNRLYAEQGRASANAMAERARALYARHREIRRIYEEDIAGGKWPHMMSQAVFGYTGWQQPDEESMPEVRSVSVPAGAALGVALEGDRRAWPEADGDPALPAFDPFADQTRSIEIFNRGRAPLRFTAAAARPWIRLDRTRGAVDRQTQLAVSIDWERAPVGRHRAPVTVRGSDGTSVAVAVETFRPADADDVRGFVETNGYVAIEAAHHWRAVGANGIEWRTIPNLGRTHSGVTVFPVTAPEQAPGEGPYLEYPVHLFGGGEVEVETILSPTLDFRGRGGLRYAVSIDDGPPQVVNVHEGITEADWERAVADNAWTRRTRHRVEGPGSHVVRIWMIDPGLVFQRIHIVQGVLPDSYLGPPESPRR
ncbi:MAG: glycosyl hydrolase 115 family protein [Pseudomonadota bacterium]|nr:glycosyl hydrolase 115 family protein [Pseudomonadota bacterium]